MYISYNKWPFCMQRFWPHSNSDIYMMIWAVSCRHKMCTKASVVATLGLFYQKNCLSAHFVAAIYHSYYHSLCYHSHIPQFTILDSHYIFSCANPWAMLMTQASLGQNSCPWLLQCNLVPHFIIIFWLRRPIVTTTDTLVRILWLQLATHVIIHFVITATSHNCTILVLHYIFLRGNPIPASATLLVFAGVSQAPNLPGNTYRGFFQFFFSLI